jgi:hypothetical protein
MHVRKRVREWTDGQTGGRERVLLLGGEDATPQLQSCPECRHDGIGCKVLALLAPYRTSVHWSAAGTPTATASC